MVACVLLGVPLRWTLESFNGQPGAANACFVRASAAVPWVQQLRNMCYG